METINVVPEGFENLACSYALPAGWNAADLGAQEFNAEDPYFFLPLVADSGDGTGAFTVGARPSYPDGTIREWLEHLCGRDQVEISNLREFHSDGLRGYLFDGRQPAEGAGIIMRNLYAEDGGVLYAVCAMSMFPMSPGSQWKSRPPGSPQDS